MAKYHLIVYYVMSHEWVKRFGLFHDELYSQGIQFDAQAGTLLLSNAATQIIVIDEIAQKHGIKCIVKPE